MARRTKEQVAADKALKVRIQTVLLREDNLGMHAVGRALVHLLNRQTLAEKLAKDTKEDNDRGFTGSDAFMGQNHAEFYKAKGYLTPNQLRHWQKKPRRDIEGKVIEWTAEPSKRLTKYWAQLMEESKKKETTK